MLARDRLAGVLGTAVRPMLVGEIPPLEAETRIARGLNTARDRMLLRVLPQFPIRRTYHHMETVANKLMKTYMRPSLGLITLRRLHRTFASNNHIYVLINPPTSIPNTNTLLPWPPHFKRHLHSPSHTFHHPLPPMLERQKCHGSTHLISERCRCSNSKRF